MQEYTQYKIPVFFFVRYLATSVKLECEKPTTNLLTTLQLYSNAADLQLAR